MHHPDAFAFNDALRALTRPSACLELFRDAIAPFGFDTFACGELDLRDRDRTVFYLIDWPDAWRRFYMNSGLIERDPLLDELGVRRAPFTWSDLRADAKLAKVGREALALCAEAGWVEGLVVPLRQGESRVGLVSLAGRRTGLTAGDAAYLSLIATCLHNHVRTLVAREGFAAPPMGLTEREIACLRLVTRGASDGAIASALGIATSTAHEFVEKAKRRLKVRSRAELAAVAVSLGIVDM